MLVPPETWFTQEVIANGTTSRSSSTARRSSITRTKEHAHARPLRHPAARSREGGPDVVVALKKIEVKELPATKIRIVSMNHFTFSRDPKGKRWAVSTRSLGVQSALPFGSRLKRNRTFVE